MRDSMFPTIFCPGCGVGNIMNYTARALDELKQDMTKVVFVSGIGCSSRLPAYFNAYGIHTTHGRAIAFATGIQLSNPDLKVIVFTGDGDCASIGGNHLLHGIRRNVDLTVIVANNNIYGMTGGQSSPTTPLGAKTTTTPYGNVEYSIDIAQLAVLLGAPYVARWTTAHPMQTIRSIKRGITKKGFSLIEILSQCPTSYGRRNELKTAVDYFKFFRENTLLYDDMGGKKTISEHRYEVEHRTLIGEFCDLEKPTFTDNWRKLCEELDESKRGGRK